MEMSGIGPICVKKENEILRLLIAGLQVFLPSPLWWTFKQYLSDLQLVDMFLQ